MDDEVHGDQREDRGEWSSASSAWAAEADRLDEFLAPVTAAMLEGARVKPGQQVLELACGPGGVGLAAAAAVGRDGTVLFTDKSDDMLATAARRAQARGLENTATRRADLDDLAALDGEFDAVVCRFGLMFAGDPATSAQGIARLLRPGGSAAVAVFDTQDRNPWLGTVFDAVGQEIGAPVPPPGVPGPFSLDGETLPAALRAGGLDDVATEFVDVDRSWPSFEAWWEQTIRLAAPVAAALEAFGPAKATAIAERARAAAEGFRDGSDLAFPGRAVVATARRTT